MRSGLRKRLLCLLLAFCLGALGGCGQAERPLTEQAVRPSTAENVDRYVAERLTTDGFPRDFCLLGDEAVFLQGTEDGGATLCAVGTDGASVRMLCALPVGARALAAGEDGTVWIMELAFDDEKKLTTNALRCFDLSGRERETLSLLEIPDAWTATGFLIADGAAWLVTSEGAWRLCAVDLKTGKERLSLPVPEGASLCRLGDGTLGILYADADGSALKTLDVKHKAFAEHYSFGLRLWSAYDGGADWDLYLDDGTNVYGFRRADGVTKKLFNYSVMGIRGAALAALGDGAFLCLSRGDEQALYHLSLYVAPADGETVTVTLAVTDRIASLMTERKVNAWNQQHPELTVEIADYSVFADADGFAAQTRLIADILAGQGPDMYDFTPGIYGQFTDSTVLAKVGLLENLMPYIEGDGEIRWDDLCLNVIQAAQLDGGLYELPTRYVYSTAVAPSSLGLREGADWAQIDAAYAACSGRFHSEICDYMRDGVSWLNEAVTVCGDRLVDWETGEAHFNDEYFLRLLRAAKEIDAQAFDPEQAFDPYLWQHQQSVNAMLYCMQYESVDMIDGETALYGDGVSYVGYPEVGGALILTQSFGISAASAHKEACWRFLRQWLLPEQSGSALLFGVNRGDMERALETHKTRRPPAGMSREEWESHSPTPLFTIENLRANMDALYEAVTTCRRLGRRDSTILGVIDDAVSPYFSGARSAEETAAVIQQKISLYLSELN